MYVLNQQRIKDFNFKKGNNRRISETYAADIWTENVTLNKERERGTVNEKKDITRELTTEKKQYSLVWLLCLFTVTSPY